METALATEDIAADCNRSHRSEQPQIGHRLNTDSLFSSVTNLCLISGCIQSVAYTAAMNRVWCALVAGTVALCGLGLAAAPSPSVVKVREWRATRERQIVAELMQLVSLPNIAANQADILKNADA